MKARAFLAAVFALSTAPVWADGTRVEDSTLAMDAAQWAETTHLFVNRCDMNKNAQTSMVFEIKLSTAFKNAAPEQQTALLQDMREKIKNVMIEPPTKAMLEPMEVIFLNVNIGVAAGFAMMVAQDRGLPVHMKPHSYPIRFNNCRKIDSITSFAYAAMEAMRQNRAIALDDRVRRMRYI